MRIPSPMPALLFTLKLFVFAFVIFDMVVLLTLLGFSRMLNWLGLIQFGWRVIHWWRGDLKR